MVFRIPISFYEYEYECEPWRKWKQKKKFKTRTNMKWGMPFQPFNNSNKKSQSFHYIPMYRHLSGTNSVENAKSSYYRKQKQ